ncbi:MAG: TMEM14 family protein [Verrucomicrobiota bacterium]
MNVIDATEIYYFILGGLTILGGIIGYVKAKSVPSIIAGTLFGLILAGAGALMVFGNTQPGLILGILATVAMAGQFIPKVMGSRAAPHVIVMAILSAIGVILTLISFAKK